MAADVYRSEGPEVHGQDANNAGMEHSTSGSQEPRVHVRDIVVLGKAGGRAEETHTPEPQSIPRPVILIILIAFASLGIMGSVTLDAHPGSRATHMGDPGLNTCCSPAWSAASCQATHCRTRKEHALHSSANGKNPLDSVLDKLANMEVDPKSAMETILELIAIIMLAFTGIALGLALGLAASWIIWNSDYLRSLLRDLFTVQHDDASPVPMAHIHDIHEGSSSSDSSDDEDDDTAVVSEQVSSHKEQGPQAQQ